MFLLKEKRRSKGLSQAELAELSGVPQQTISAIESQQRPNAGIETVYQLAKALNCPIYEIYTPDGDNAESSDAKGGREHDGP